MASYDYKKEALSLLLPQFDDSVLLRGTIEGLLEPTDEWQDAVDKLMTAYNLDDSKGSQLDIIGKLLNVKRLAQSDDDYRKDIKIRIIINSATGTGANFIKMLKLVLGDDFRFRITEQFPATVIVTMLDPQDLINQSVIDDIIPIGVGAVFYSNAHQTKTVWFVSDVDPITGLPDPQLDAILPDVANLGVSDMTLINIYYVS